MREIRWLVSWVLALFLGAMFLLIADLTLFRPAGEGASPLFQVLADSSGIAFFEPTGRLVVGAAEVLAALLLIIPWTRRLGAILALLVSAGAAAMAFQLMNLKVEIPSAPGGPNVDANTLLYLALALLVGSLLLVFAHPGRDRDG